MDEFNAKKKLFAASDDKIEYSLIKNTEGKEIYLWRINWEKIKAILKKLSKAKGKFLVKDYEDTENIIESEELDKVDAKNRYVSLKINTNEKEEDELIHKQELASEVEKLTNPRGLIKLTSVLNKSKTFEVNCQGIHINEPKDNFEPIYLHTAEEMKAKINKTVAKVDNESQRPGMVRIEYVEFIKNYNPKTSFDLYQIPTLRDRIIYVSKKYLINKFDIVENEYVQVKIKGTPHLVLKKELLVEPTRNRYTFTMKDGKQETVDWDDLEVVIITDVINKLPEQPEEKVMEDFNKTKKNIVSNDDNKEYMLIKTIEGNEAFIHRKYYNEIKLHLKKVNKKKAKYLVKDMEDKEIIINSEILDKVDDSNRYIPIKIKTETGVESDLVKRKEISSEVSKLANPNEMINLKCSKKGAISAKGQDIEIQEVKPAPPAFLIHFKEEMIEKLNKTFVRVENEDPQEKYIRSEYVTLIKNHKPKTAFDRYQIPDDKKNIIYRHKRWHFIQ